MTYQEYMAQKNQVASQPSVDVQGKVKFYRNMMKLLICYSFSIAILCYFFIEYSMLFVALQVPTFPIFLLLMNKFDYWQARLPIEKTKIRYNIHRPKI